MFRRTFTLIELLVVIAIITILASMLMPAHARARRQSRLIPCMSNLGQMGQVLYMYRGDNNDQLPTASEEGDAGEIYEKLYEEGYLETREILSCPGNPVDEVKFREREHVSYLIDPTMPDRRHQMRAIMADDEEKENHAGGVNVLFEDGHVNFVKSESGRASSPYIEDDGNIFAAREGKKGDPEDAWIRWEEDDTVDPGAFGWYALDFDGTHGVEIPDSRELFNDHIQGEGKVSFSAWVKRSEAARQYIMNSHGRFSSRSSEFMFGVRGHNKFEAFAHDSGSSPVFNPQGVGDEDYPLGEWFHVAYTADGDDFKIYLNGNEVYSEDVTPVSVVPWDKNIRIGYVPYGNGDRSWDGLIADIRIYDEGLSGADIEKLSNGENVFANLVGHWPMNEGTGDIARDVVGGEDGVLGPDFPTDAPEWVPLEKAPWELRGRGVE